MKKYMAYLDDGYDCYKVAIPAENEKAARAFADGNGEIIAIKDVTEDYPISLNKIEVALRAASFGKHEIDFIIRALCACKIGDYDY